MILRWIPCFVLVLIAGLLSGCSGWGQPAYDTPHLDGEPVTEAQWLREARKNPEHKSQGRYGMGIGPIGRD